MMGKDQIRQNFDLSPQFLRKYVVYMLVLFQHGGVRNSSSASAEAPLHPERQQTIYFGVCSLLSIV